MCVTLALIVVLFSSYSLLSLPIPEVTPYGTDDSFSLFSHHYQRLYYQIAIGAVLLWAEKGPNESVVMWLFVPDIYWANLFILILQMIGWLSNPFVTALYFMEQGEILFFGGTARASDSRIVASFLLSVVLVAIFTHSDISTNADLTIVYALAAIVLSKNWMHTMGLKKPFKVDNDETDRQKLHAEIVFANLEPNHEIEEIRKQERQMCSPKTMIFNAAGIALVLLSAIVF